jgi:hypothetical protein
MVAQESTAQKDEEIIISIVKEMTESMTGAQSTRHWAEDALWFDIPPFASRGIPGQQTVLDRLLDVLFVMAMRASFEQSSTAPRWYHAVSEPRLGRALEAMHDEPERPWTVTELANLSAMSRPSFARNFERALGQ